MSETKGAIAFEVKTIETKNPDGEFEAVLSVPSLDRDGEIIDAKAFEPLPGQITVHLFHEFNRPVATAQPYYDGDVLKAQGVFDPDEEVQTKWRPKIGRSLGFMSVGFMAAEREDVDGVTHIKKAELLEASFVSVPSNREAAILAVKQYEAKVGARNSRIDSEHLQAAHDAIVRAGATCETKDEDDEPEKSFPRPSVDGRPVPLRPNPGQPSERGQFKTATTTDPETVAAAPAADAVGAAAAQSPAHEVDVARLRAEVARATLRLIS